MFTQLIIAVDGSDCSTRAAKFGLELAKQYGADVDVVYATKGKNNRGEEILGEIEDLDVELDTAFETHLIEGKPRAVINAQAAERDADLIVMGRRGRSGIEEYLLGNVAERVLRTADVPVLTVPGGDLGSETGRSYEDVLLTTDRSEIAEQAAPYAGDIATKYDAVLHLLTVLDMEKEAGIFDAGGVSEEFLNRLQREAHDTLDELEEAADAGDIDVETTVIEGKPHSEIGEYADEHGIDLVVMASASESSLVEQRLGSTTDRVLRTVAEPVLVVPVGE